MPELKKLILNIIEPCKDKDNNESYQINQYSLDAENS